MSRDMKRGSYQKDGSCRGAPNLARLVSVTTRVFQNLITGIRKERRKLGLRTFGGSSATICVQRTSLFRSVATISTSCRTSTTSRARQQLVRAFVVRNSRRTATRTARPMYLKEARSAALTSRPTRFNVEGQCASTPHPAASPSTRIKPNS